jgi:HEAT repeat protein
VATELLGRFQAVSATEELTDLLQHDASIEVRARAARSLGRIGSPRAVEPLLACLAGGPAAVRAQAVLALGRLGAAEAVPALRRLLLDPAHTLSEQSAQALAAISPLGTAVLAQEAESDDYAGRTARQALEAAQGEQTGLLSPQY